MGAKMWKCNWNRMNKRNLWSDGVWLRPRSRYSQFPWVSQFRRCRIGSGACTPWTPVWPGAVHHCSYSQPGSGQTPNGKDIAAIQENHLDVYTCVCVGSCLCYVVWTICISSENEDIFGNRIFFMVITDSKGCLGVKTCFVCVCVFLLYLRLVPLLSLWDVLGGNALVLHADVPQGCSQVWFGHVHLDLDLSLLHLALQFPDLLQDSSRDKA